MIGKSGNPVSAKNMPEQNEAHQNPVQPA